MLRTIGCILEVLTKRRLPSRCAPLESGVVFRGVFIQGEEGMKRFGLIVAPARLRFILYSSPDGSYIPGTGMSFRRR